MTMSRQSPRIAVTMWLVVAALASAACLVSVSAAVRSLRLYVFDCGTLASADMSRYRLTVEEVSTTKMAVGCFLIAHPRGVMVWDVGAVPDSTWTPTGRPEVQHLTLPDGQMREVTMTRRLLPQLTEAGYSPADITYLALSHYHWDHTANANAFASATWLARPVERDAMLAASAPPLTQPATYSALRSSKVRPITGDDFDVFGDGSVVIKLAAGHTPGHQVLFVRLPKTGPVVISGDLYHYPEERALGRIPTFEVDQAQTAASRQGIERFLKRSGAQLWIQHDFAGNAKLRKAPAYYE